VLARCDWQIYSRIRITSDSAGREQFAACLILMSALVAALLQRGAMKLGRDGAASG
jgi:hypothetical protein